MEWVRGIHPLNIMHVELPGIFGAHGCLHRIRKFMWKASHKKISSNTTMSGGRATAWLKDKVFTTCSSPHES
ncbi:unnamed protein product [Victoria cruziana]